MDVHDFLKKWTYPRHAAAVTALYASLAMAGNCLLSPGGTKQQNAFFPCKACGHQARKRQRFNKGLAVLYTIDMTATYLFLDHLRKKCGRPD